MKKYRLELKGYESWQHLTEVPLVLYVHVDERLSDVVDEVLLVDCSDRPEYLESFGDDDSDHLPDVVFLGDDVSGEALNPAFETLRDVAANRLLRADLHNNAEDLDAKYNPDGDGEHPVLTRQCWRDAVCQEETISGYWEWVEHLIRDSSTGMSIDELVAEYG